MSRDFFPLTFPSLPATAQQERADADSRAAGYQLRHRLSGPGQSGIDEESGPG